MHPAACMRRRTAAPPYLPFKPQSQPPPPTHLDFPAVSPRVVVAVCPRAAVGWVVWVHVRAAPTEVVPVARRRRVEAAAEGAGSRLAPRYLWASSVEWFVYELQC